MRRPHLAVALLGALALAPACTHDCGQDVYPDTDDASERLATALTRGETGPPLPFEDVVRGEGRIVQWGRRVRARASFRTEDGTPLGQAEVDFLFPAVEPHDGVARDVDSGEVPVYFGPVLGGMRVGGTRRFTLPVHHAPEPWRLRGSGQPAATEVPADRPVVTDLEVLDVCKPRICVRTTWSVPAMADRRIVEGRCR